MDEFILIPNKVTKVFISMPMNGLSYKRIVNKCNDILIANDLTPKYCEIVNLLPKHKVKQLSPLECFIYSIEKLTEADFVIIYGDNSARGVSLEQQICDKYQIPYIRAF